MEEDQPEDAGGCLESCAGHGGYHFEDAIESFFCGWKIRVGNIIYYSILNEFAGRGRNHGGQGISSVLLRLLPECQVRD